jgi:hypothetical protein
MAVNSKLQSVNCAFRKEGNFWRIILNPSFGLIVFPDFIYHRTNGICCDNENNKHVFYNIFGPLV